MSTQATKKQKVTSTKSIEVTNIMNDDQATTTTITDLIKAYYEDRKVKTVKGGINLNEEIKKRLADLISANDLIGIEILSNELKGKPGQKTIKRKAKDAAKRIRRDNPRSTRENNSSPANNTLHDHGCSSSIRNTQFATLVPASSIVLSSPDHGSKTVRETTTMKTNVLKAPKKNVSPYMMFKKHMKSEDPNMKITKQVSVVTSLLSFVYNKNFYYMSGVSDVTLFL